MNFRRKLRSVFAIVLVASLAVPVLLYPPRISSQEISVDRYAYTETTTVENNIDHQAFSIEPIHLFVFIFRGNNPSQYRTIDTSNCLEDYLYVHDSTDGSVRQLSNQKVKTYTATQERVYYITEDNHILQATYQGGEPNPITTVEYDKITEFDYFNNKLYFVANGSKVVVVDLVTQQSTVALEEYGIDALLIVSDSVLVWQNEHEKNIVIDLKLGKKFELSNAQEVNILLDSEQNTAQTRSNNYVTQENDIPIPFAGTEYDAPAHAVHDFSFLTDYYFHKFPDKEEYYCYHPYNKPDDEMAKAKSYCAGYGGAGECDGFARFAHDYYFHMVDWTKGAGNWSRPADKYYTGDDFDADNDGTEEISTIRDFFYSIPTGTFVRYGKGAYTTSGIGAHSIVFHYATETGIWAYECNQDERCGIHYQFYPYSKVSHNYNYIHHYIKHSLDNGQSEGATTHKVSCTTDNCGAYLRQNHSNDAYFPQSITHHQQGCSTCNYAGGTLAEHVFIGDICKICKFDRNGPIIFG